MIVIAGAGAMADAAKAMRRIQKNLDRRVDRFRDARDRGLRGEAAIPERVDFPCAILCSACGYFYIDDEGDDEEVASVDHSLCPFCGREAWLDLQREDNADLLRRAESEERHSVPSWLESLVLWGSVGLFGALAVALYTWGVGDDYFGETFYSDLVILTVISSVVAIPAAYHTLPRRLAILLRRGRERWPHRWHSPTGLPDPEVDPSRRHTDLEAHSDNESLEAPISGRECLAYQVCVLFDVTGDARPPEWALQEQHAVDLELGDDLAVTPQELFLESPVEQVDAPGGEELTFDSAPAGGHHDEQRRDEIARFLRQRGLFIADGQFHFYEARLEEGDHVDVADYGDTCVVRHTSSADPDDIAGLPQIDNAR
jgi:hypothetical protein